MEENHSSEGIRIEEEEETTTPPLLQTNDVKQSKRPHSIDPKKRTGSLRRCTKVLTEGFYSRHRDN